MYWYWNAKKNLFVMWRKKNFDEPNILQAMTFIFIFWNSEFTVCFCVDLTSDVEIVLFLTFNPEVKWITEISFWFTNSSVHLYDHVISKRTEHKQFTFVLLRIESLVAFNMKNVYYFFSTEIRMEWKFHTKHRFVAVWFHVWL